MAQAGDLRMEMVQRLPEGARAPRSVPHNGGDYRGPCCFDCGAADTLVKLDHVFDFEQARIAVGNDRQEQYRMPGAPLGLVQQRLVRPSEAGDLEEQHRWLDKNNWFEITGEDRYGEES